jgi:small-conductance mechanosensitive channel
MEPASLAPARLRSRLAALACGWIAGLLCAAANAAGPLAELTGGGGGSAEVDEVETIPAGEIPLRADVDERFALGVAERARQRDPSTELGPRLDSIAAGIDRLNDASRQQDLEGLPVVRLQGIENHWRFYERELARWREELEQAMAPFAVDAAALAERRASWVATQRALDDGGVPGALRQRVAGILGQIGSAERALSRPLETQIRLGRRANAVSSTIDAGRRGVDAAIAHYDRRLRSIDAPPLWQAWHDTQSTAGERRGAERGLGAEAGFLREWAAANPDRLLGYAITVAALLPLLLWLAYRSRAVVPADAETQAAARVLQRPLAAWFVLAFVGLPFFFPEAPLILYQLGLLLAVIPVLRLLPPKVYEYLGPWPYIATALYVAYRLGFVVLGQPLYHRLHLLFVAVVAAGALAWLLLGSRREPEAGGIGRRVLGALRTAGWLAVAALLVAIVANLAGSVTLAAMLTGAVLDSAYIGLALFAGAHVLASVVSLVLARRSPSRFRLITQHAGPLLESLTKLIGVAALLAWVVATANEFRIARPVFRWVRSVVTYPLEIGEISITLGSVLLFGFSVWLAFWVARTVRLVLRDEVLPKMSLPRGVGNSVSTLSYYALVLVGLMFALAAAGFEATQFALVIGALGVGIGFGLQNVVNNFVSGLILMFERPIQPGDVVEVSGTSGKVRDIGMRATTLTTFEGADVVVPNGTLLSEKLINWTLSDMNRRIDVEVGVAYGSDPRRVITLLREVAVGTPGIVPEPEPAIVFKGLGPSALEFGIRAWTHDFGDWVAIRTEMTARVYETLGREGIEIPLPQQDLNLRSVSPEAAARLGATAPSSRAPPQPAAPEQC